MIPSRTCPSFFLFRVFHSFNHSFGCSAFLVFCPFVAGYCCAGPSTEHNTLEPMTKNHTHHAHTQEKRIGQLRKYPNQPVVGFRYVGMSWSSFFEGDQEPEKIAMGKSWGASMAVEDTGSGLARCVSLSLSLSLSFVFVSRLPGGFTQREGCCYGFVWLVSVCRSWFCSVVSGFEVQVALFGQSRLVVSAVDDLLDLALVRVCYKQYKQSFFFSFSKAVFGNGRPHGWMIRLPPK